MSAKTPLTLRNLTSIPVELKSIGYFGRSAIASVEDAVTGANKSAATSTTEQAKTHQKIAKSEDVSFKLETFQTVKTDKQLASESSQVRLTLLYDGTEHQFDYHLDKFQCKDLTSEAGPKLTAIHVPKEQFVTIFSSSNLNSWMRNLKDDTPVSGLSIPGTHNAPAFRHALPSVRCQAVPPREQLENGVRFFDIRARVVDPATDKLELVHSVFPVSLTGRKYFRDLVNDIFNFLAANPSETVLMTVKREGMGHATDEQMSKVLHEHYAGDPSKWYTAPRIPYLGEARGKIVLIRRFNLDESLRGEYGGAGWGIDAGGWADNTPDALCPSGDIRIQDFYQVMRTSTVATKTQYVTEQMARSSGVVTALPPSATANPAHATAAPVEQQQQQPAEKQPIFINFLSASNFFNPMCWPEKIAAKLNPSVVDYLCTMHNQGDEQGGGPAAGDGCTGIVVCDWVGYKGNWDLVRAIVGWNARLENREKSTT